MKKLLTIAVLLASFASFTAMASEEDVINNQPEIVTGRTPNYIKVEYPDQYQMFVFINSGTKIIYHNASRTLREGMIVKYIADLDEMTGLNLGYEIHVYDYNYNMFK